MDAFCAIGVRGLGLGLPNLSHRTYCALLLPLMDELASSDREVVSFVARHCVYFRRMFYLIGCNSLFYCRRFGVRLSDILIYN